MVGQARQHAAWHVLYDMPHEPLLIDMPCGLTRAAAALAHSHVRCTPLRPTSNVCSAVLRWHQMACIEHVRRVLTSPPCMQRKDCECGFSALSPPGYGVVWYNVRAVRALRRPHSAEGRRQQADRVVVESIACELWSGCSAPSSLLPHCWRSAWLLALPLPRTRAQELSAQHGLDSAEFVAGFSDVDSAIGDLGRGPWLFGQRRPARRSRRVSSLQLGRRGRSLCAASQGRWQ